MTHRRVVLLVSTLVLAASVACGPGIDLAKAVSVTDIVSGYYDDGTIKDGAQAGWTHILPTATFKLKNESADSLGGVKLTVSFWADGKDGESDSRELPGISAETPLAPGAVSEPITARSTVGFNLEAPRGELFNQPRFVDWTIKLFAKRGGRIVPIGAIKVDRRLIPHQKDSNRP